MPGRQGWFFGLTDRGPNADDPLGRKSEPLPSFTPEIGEFKLVDGNAELQKTITLKGPKNVKGPQGVFGEPYSGRPPATDTTEVIDDVAQSHGTTGVPVARDPDGYDSEGLVALTTARSGSRTSTARTSPTSTPTATRSAGSPRTTTARTTSSTRSSATCRPNTPIASPTRAWKG